MKRKHLGILFVLSITIPYLIAYLTTPVGYQFTGFLSYSVDNATYLSKMENNANLIFINMYNHLEHSGWYIFTLYSIMGKIAQEMNVSSMLIFHFFRVVFSIGFFFSVCSLLKEFRLSKEKEIVVLFFVLFGNTGEYIFYILSKATGVQGVEIVPFIAELTPFVSALLLPHFIFALTLQCIAWKLAFVYKREKKIEYTMALGLIFLLYSTVHPYSAVLTGLSIGLFLVISFYQGRNLSWKTTYPLIYMGLFPLIYLIPMYIQFKKNPVLLSWIKEAVLNLPPLLGNVIVLGLGCLFILYFSIQKTNWKGLNLALMIWIWMSIFAALIPSAARYRFLEGICIPFFFLFGLWVVKWFQKKKFYVISLAVFISGTSIILILEPFWKGQTENFHRYMNTDIVDAYEWIEQSKDKHTVVISDPYTSNYIPAYAKTPVFFGHQHETPRYKVKKALWKEFEKNPKKQWKSGWIMSNNITYIVINDFRTNLDEKDLKGIPLKLAYQNKHIKIYQVADT